MSGFEFEQIFSEATVAPAGLLSSSSVFFLKAWHFGAQWSELPGQVQLPPAPEVTGWRASLWWPSLGSEASFRGSEYMRSVGRSTAPCPTVRLPHHCFTEWGVTGFDIWLRSRVPKKASVFCTAEILLPLLSWGSTVVTPTVSRQGVGAPWSPHIHVE